MKEQFRFDKEAKIKAIKSVLADIKGDIMSRTLNFDIIYEQQKLKSGFGFKLVVENAKHKFTSETRDEFYNIKNYVADLLDFAFSDQVSIGNFVNISEEKAEYEIICEF